MEFWPKHNTHRIGNYPYTAWIIDRCIRIGLLPISKNKDYLEGRWEICVIGKTEQRLSQEYIKIGCRSLKHREKGTNRSQVLYTMMNISLNLVCWTRR